MAQFLKNFKKRQNFGFIIGIFFQNIFGAVDDDILHPSVQILLPDNFLTRRFVFSRYDDLTASRNLPQPGDRQFHFLPGSGVAPPPRSHNFPAL